MTVRQKKLSNARKAFYMAVAFLAIVISLLVLILMLGMSNQLPGSFPNPDTNRDIHQLIESRGFQSEPHFVTTEKGYILQLVRIVNPHVENRAQLKPALLVHGFQCTGTLWVVTSNGTLSNDGHYYEFDEHKNVINGSDTVANTLGFVLATRGYDVWLSNYRGSIYSTNHTTISPDDSEFWKFNIDDMIDEDIPAIVNHIKEITKRDSIAYIGHSQGSFMMLGLLSKNHTYSDVIKPFIAVSPVFYSHKVLTPVRHMYPFRNLMRSYPGFFPKTLLSRRHRYPNLCDNIYLKRICYWLFSFTLGSHEKNLDMNRMGVYIANVPMGSSTWNAAHFLQMLPEGVPARFDYGDKETNLAKYGLETPPKYNVSNIKSNHIALIYTQNDWFNHLDSVNMLKTTLNVTLLDDYAVPDETWNHMDLIWAKEAGKYVNTRILDILEQY